MSRSRTVPRRPDPVRVEDADKDRAVLIFSWPPNQSPRKPNGLANFEQLNKALAEMLIALAMSASVKIAISLHPTLVDTPLGAELKGAGLYVIDKPLIDVIDCADMFCATVSSTLLWSVQMGIPSVNFDIYSYVYQEFVEAGMSEVISIPALRSELLRLIEDHHYRASVVERIKERKQYWTLADGRAQQRILEINPADYIQLKRECTLGNPRSLRRNKTVLIIGQGSIAGATQDCCGRPAQTYSLSAAILRTRS